MWFINTQCIQNSSRIKLKKKCWYTETMKFRVKFFLFCNKENHFNWNVHFDSNGIVYHFTSFSLSFFLTEHREKAKKRINFLTINFDLVLQSLFNYLFLVWWKKKYSKNQSDESTKFDLDCVKKEDEKKQTSNLSQANTAHTLFRSDTHSM